MKTLSTLLLLIFLALTPASAGTPEPVLQTQVKRVTPVRTELKRGPQNTQFASFQGLTLRFQNGQAGPNWTEFTGSAQELSRGDVQLSIAPSMFTSAAGQSAAGAVVELKIPQAGLEVSHTSQFGSLERHLTRAVLSVNDGLELQAMHTSVGGKVNTRVGPAVKLTSGLDLWYGFSTDGGQDLVLLTGNLKF